MEKSALFDRNILALSKRDPELCALLLKIQAAGNNSGNRYTFSDSRTGEKIPALFDTSGIARPLHSLMDPRKEARRLIDSGEGGSFLILLGLGAGYYAEAALERDDVSRVLVIEFNVSGITELFNHLDYTRLFSDPRFSLFVDTTDTELNRIILNTYQPVLCGRLALIPLRPRTSMDSQLFSMAAKTISLAIDKVSADYSVQAHFGKRWFSNIIRNIKNIEEIEEPLASVKKAIVTAAGPSLTLQIKQLHVRPKDSFLIATDTSLPCLLNAGIIPDAVISIDCQHISYYHFMDGLPEKVRLFLDLASPPLLSSLSKNRRYFSCGHPLTRHISRSCGKLHELDCSGGNVTYAAVSLAELLGAEEIELYGADYAYPRALSYAKGTYIYPFFEKKASRFAPMEAQASAFLYRTPLEKKIADNSWYYQTKTLNFYREKLEEKSRSMESTLIPIKGIGAPISIERYEKPHNKFQATSKPGFPSEKSKFITSDFLSGYMDDISKLPKPGKNSAEYMNSLNEENETVFTTLLPLAASLKRKNPAKNFPELFEEVRDFCIKEIKTINNEQ